MSVNYNLSNGFLNQIKEDLDEYKEKYGAVNSNILKDEWAFNFWVLDKLYNVDENIIFDYITDYNDKGIDAWVYHEDTNDLYLVQNKFYSDNTPLSKDYVMNDFLVRSLGALENGTYTRCEELQKQFTKHCEEKSFSVHLMLYVTNNNISKEVYESVKQWNVNHKDKKYAAKIISISDIYEEYFEELVSDQKKLTVSITTKNKATTLTVDNENYGTEQAIDAKYVMTSVVDIYRMVKLAKNKGYQIFDKNIREYLGSNGKINKQIKITLDDDNDRKNFFFYNNGITVISDDFKKSGNSKIDIVNPQIVNGCQTVSTIYESLDCYPENQLDTIFDKCYVMTKILKIDTEKPGLQQLYNNIVKYNNSQNAIKEKQFAADRSEFYRLQKEFEKHGFYLCVKQSDAYKFKKNVKLSDCLPLAENRIKKFGIKKPTTTKPFIIDLDKLLQVIISFTMNSHEAVQNKSKLLKENSKQNDSIIEFIRDTNVTINTLLDLYCFYLRCEQERGKDKNPNTFMLIDAFSYFVCNGKKRALITQKLSNDLEISTIINLYGKSLKFYYGKYTEENPGKEYNDMIKDEIDYQKLKSYIDMAQLMSSL